MQILLYLREVGPGIHEDHGAEHAGSSPLEWSNVANSEAEAEAAKTNETSNEDSAGSDVTSIFVSRVYANVVEKKPPEYWNYSAYEIHLGNGTNYLLGQSLGGGHYGEAFVSNKRDTDEVCVVKLLHSIHRSRIKRELHIMNILKGGPNIVELMDVIESPKTNYTAFVFEFVNSTFWPDLRRVVTDYDVRYYMFEMLRTLDYAHSRGIMHRDVKPNNIMIDHDKNRTIRLIDWGLGEFYYPNEVYSVHVATRQYKGPELLLGYGTYDYSLDLWSLGCVLAGIIFHKTPFFDGEDDGEVLQEIIKVLGNDDLYEYADKYELKVPDAVKVELGKGSPKKDWTQFINLKYLELVSMDALDLVDNLVRYDHRERLSAYEAMGHPYFAPVREPRTESDSKYQSDGAEDYYHARVDVDNRNDAEVDGD